MICVSDSRSLTASSLPQCSSLSTLTATAAPSSLAPHTSQNSPLPTYSRCKSDSHATCRASHSPKKPEQLSDSAANPATDEAAESALCAFMAPVSTGWNGEPGRLEGRGALLRPSGCVTPPTWS